MKHLGEQVTEEDIELDVRALIERTVRPYVDPSNPMLHFDELQAECRLRLAMILDSGKLAGCPTRKKKFAYLKVCFRNHVFTLIQKHAFTAKRTGVLPAKRARTSSGEVPVPKKAIKVYLDDPNTRFEVGAEDHGVFQRELLEELVHRLSESERIALENALDANLPNSFDDAPRRRPNEKNAAERLSARAQIVKKFRQLLYNS